MVVVIGIVIGLAVGAGVAFLSLYAFAGSRLAAARRTRQLLVTEAKRESDVMRREAQSEADAMRREGQIEAREASPGGSRSRRRQLPFLALVMVWSKVTVRFGNHVRCRQNVE